MTSVAGWWIVLNTETSEELPAQWIEESKLWRIFDGQMLPEHSVKALRPSMFDKRSDDGAAG